MTIPNDKSPPILPSLTGLLEDPSVDTVDDARKLVSYLARSPTLPPIPMAIGDPYLLGGGLPAKLAAYERKAPGALGGYTRTPAGAPEARRSIASTTIQRQGLDLEDAGREFNLHLTSGTGTRGIMGDFGRYMLDKTAADGRTPVVLCAAPTWDYAGVFEPMGYKMLFWPLRVENGWLPDAADIQQALDRIDKNNATQRLALVVVNAQHNPTGASWGQETLTMLYEAATGRGAGILLDDPYNAVVTNRAQPVSAPALLFEHFARTHATQDTKRAWCRVESFGKAFSCNDWGIGSIMAHPDTLRQLSGYTFRWAFPRAGKRQWAMARWLADPASDRYLARQRTALGRKRSLWAKTLRQLGWPGELVPTGEATPYFLTAVPPRFLREPDGIARWRQELLDTTGLLFSFASIEQEGTAADIPFLRAYLGGSEKVVEEAVRRLVKAGVRYQ